MAIENVLRFIRNSLFKLSLSLEPKERLVLIEAIIKVESTGNDFAIGDKHLKNKAFGPMQIRQPCVDDVNKAFKTSYKAAECWGDRTLSKWIFCRYMDIYAGKDATYEKMARIWNGGPLGYKRAITVNYWKRVKKHL